MSCLYYIFINKLLNFSKIVGHIWVSSPGSFWLMEKIKFRNNRVKDHAILQKWKTMPLYDKTMTRYDKTMPWYENNMTLSRYLLLLQVQILGPF